ncbi:MAG: tRNA uridine(34) 5-carboxymethylaminomethyl modification radical SAM/GNAT enzyme Elp3 [Deltaproteobacteria bacterium]|nr:tRNA uridine(34) 5-carboxymethylaminomethyl modification radical SAM/GNAT enzyme Elp3 [Deltaproteobacteria bacterium]
MSARSIQATSDEKLRAIIAEAIAAESLGARALDRILRRHPKDGRGFYTKREVLAAFRASASEWPLAESAFAEKLRTTPTRTLSGVAPVAVLTKPFPCPGRCVFCPSDVRMPKSYLANEPGCQRAQANRFDPYLQAWNRLAAFRAMGHSTAKVELIVLGGTWSFYPESYQVWFATRLFDALNDFGAGVDRRDEIAAFAPDFASLALGSRGYDATVAAHLRAGDGELVPASERGEWSALAAAQRANERAGARCVGLALETRPDHVTRDEVLRLRRLGATKVQLGIQSLDDAVLAANQRGHDIAATREAIALLRGAGFKVHAHWMANLLGATPASDRADFARLFDDPAIRPDELKLYPCSLVETAELVHHHARGEWRAYTREELLPLVADCLAAIPRWCRATRVIRDIPSQDIVTGSKETNLREAAEALLRERGTALQEIRAREVRNTARDDAPLTLRETRYATSIGDEIFLELTTTDDRIAAFARVSHPRAGSTQHAPIAELHGAALLREVHVYGAAAGFNERAANKAQHAGLGAKLVKRAAAIARDTGFARLSVISAVGTRDWYRRQHFTDGDLYQHLAL